MGPHDMAKSIAAYASDHVMLDVMELGGVTQIPPQKLVVTHNDEIFSLQWMTFFWPIAQKER